MLAETQLSTQADGYAFRKRTFDVDSEGPYLRGRQGSDLLWYAFTQIWYGSSREWRSLLQALADKFAPLTFRLESSRDAW